jgi:hypothetical protein
MSDYLGNLIARTFSSAVPVRPRSASLFEPAPVSRETTGLPKFEQENFVEQPPTTERSERVAPMPLLMPTPRQSVLGEPRQSVPEISPAEKILKPGPESELPPPPISVLGQSSVQKLSRMFSRLAPTLGEDKPSDSTRRRSDIIKSLLPEVVASASHEGIAREEAGSFQPATALKPVAISEERERASLTRSASQAIVPTIRALPPVAPLSAAPAPPPTINVTIGRVEVRAVSPPAQQRARPKPAKVLSLGDYLRQRANGGRR